MNCIAPVKIEQLHNEHDAIDEAILKAFNSKNDAFTRELIDQRRQLRSILEREYFQEHKSGNTDLIYYKSNKKIESTIKEWCNRINDITNEPISFKNPNFCNLFLDHCLPEVWNFNQDITVVYNPPSPDVIKQLQARKQKNILIYAEDESFKNLAGFCTTTGTKICDTIKELERHCATLQVGAKKIIFIPCEKIKQEVADTISNAVKAGRRTANENTTAASKFGKAWAKNVLGNLTQLTKAKNLFQLKVDGTKKAVIVASGPSLAKNVHLLKKVQKHIFIVSALRSLPILAEAGVQPDLVIQLDAENDEIAKNVAKNTKQKIKNLLIEAVISPHFFKIKADDYIWSLSQHFSDLHKALDTRPTPFNEPSVSIYALQLCRMLGMHDICFIGQDLAATGGKPYADGTTSLLPNHTTDAMFHIEVAGFHGDTVMTRNSFEYQIKRCEELAQEWQEEQPELNLVNATEGGAFIPGFEHMTLSSTNNDST